MKKTGLIVLLSSILTSSACVMAVVDHNQYSPVEKYEEIIPFEPDGELALVNFDGDIEITGWDQWEVDIYAKKHLETPRGGRLQFLWEKRTVPQINVENYGNGVKISTRAPSQSGALVDYFINLPRSIHIKDITAREGRIFISGIYGSIRAELAGGDIEVENFSGSLTALVTLGSITAGLYDLREEDDILLNCREGDITVFLQEEVQASVYAEAPNGTIIDEFQLEKENGGLIDSRIGEGGASVRITALNGNIQIKKNILDNQPDYSQAGLPQGDEISLIQCRPGELSNEGSL